MLASKKDFLNKKNVAKEKIRGLRNPGWPKKCLRSMGGGVSSNPEVRKWAVKSFGCVVQWS